MVGISYPGISQLFVAATQPPHLAGITPLSVVGDVWADALYPGGILNTGFVVPWADDRQSDAQPAPEGGQGWAKRRVRAGDEVCADNQTLRLQTVDVRKEIDSQAYRSYQDSALISPNQLSQNIKVPVFLAGSWQDEQTGAGWPDLIPGLLGRVPLKVTMTNGTHSDSLGPDVITRWAEFLDFYVAREQGVFHQNTPLTLAETASVFGETVTFGRLLSETNEPNQRLALLAESLEGQIATVFRQVAMNQFEDSAHTWRREQGEVSVEQFGDLWISSQSDMLGDSVELTEGYRSWWSYIPHFIGTPGYVYAYAYGQLLALSVYQLYEERGTSFVDSYLELLRQGGSKSPQELGHIVGVDLYDPTFWDGGLSIIEEQLNAAEQAALTAQRITLP